MPCPSPQSPGLVIVLKAVPSMFSLFVHRRPLLDYLESVPISPPPPADGLIPMRIMDSNNEMIIVIRDLSSLLDSL